MLRNGLVVMVFLGLLFLAPAALHAQYTTPDTGVNWTMTDLVANSGGVVLGATPNFTLTDSLIISATDTVTMAPGDVLTVTAGANYEIIVDGGLNATGTAASRIVFTSSAITASDWLGILVQDGGCVNLSYCDIMYGNDVLHFKEVSNDSPSSTVTNCNITDNSDQGIYCNYFNAALTVSNCDISGNGGSGFCSECAGTSAVITLSNNTFDSNGTSGVYVDYGCGITVSGNTITNNNSYGVDVYEGGWNTVISNNTITGNTLGGISLNTDNSSGGDGATITGNTISDNTGYGIYTYYVVGLTISNNTIENNDGYGIDTYGALSSQIFGNTVSGNSEGIYVDDGFPSRKATQTTYNWIEVNTDNADEWMTDEDDNYLDSAAIGFDFPVDGNAYDYFQVNSNGVIELAEGDNTDDLSDYEGSGYLKSSYSGQTFIFAYTDDFADDIATTWPMETHNGNEVQMNGFGYRYFEAGALDGDGNVVPEKCLVVRWYMPYICELDDPIGLWNDFQVVIFPDGRVQWNTRAMNGIYPEYAQTCELYAGAMMSRSMCLPASATAPRTPSSMTPPTTWTRRRRCRRTP
jgi:parallel beta-helix repeat protein